MNSIVKDKTFVIEIAVKIEVEAKEFPDGEAASVMEKIKTKIFCNRECMSLIGSKIDVYEVIMDEED